MRVRVVKFATLGKTVRTFMQFTFKERKFPFSILFDIAVLTHDCVAAVLPAIVNVPVSISDVHDNCEHEMFPKKEVTGNVLGTLVK